MLGWRLVDDGAETFEALRDLSSVGSRLSYVVAQARVHSHERAGVLATPRINEQQFGVETPLTQQRQGGFVAAAKPTIEGPEPLPRPVDLALGVDRW